MFCHLFVEIPGLPVVEVLMLSSVVVVVHPAVDLTFELWDVAIAPQAQLLVFQAPPEPLDEHVERRPRKFRPVAKL